MVDKFSCSNVILHPLSPHYIQVISMNSNRKLVAIFAVLINTDVKSEIPADFQSTQPITQTLMLHFQLGHTTVDSIPSKTIHSELFFATHMVEKGFP